jgi:hypothetical protein
MMHHHHFLVMHLLVLILMHVAGVDSGAGAGSSTILHGAGVGADACAG